ncbi:hypothetical protein HER39_02415 [Arthrobacter deserti]|uniref:Uncharacterized protein n=1 Tax=Arthrobacter deserti TaxID=1742687 RepID=A0ABX1JMJ7_9MICC|nr:hypothetical protein [Arthrobacter deserti]
MPAQLFRNRVAGAAMTTILFLGHAAEPVAADAEASLQPGPQGVSSGIWGAVATTAAQAPYGNGPLALRFNASLLAPPPPQFFTLGNTGTLRLTAATFTVTATTGTAVLEVCSTAWNETNNTCPQGTITEVVRSGTAPRSASISPVNGGGTIRARARITSAIVSASDVGISVSVNRAQVRAATVANQ